MYCKYRYMGIKMQKSCKKFRKALENWKKELILQSQSIADVVKW